jgi:glycosyltransferase involved in cell wall biosynthesis
VKVLLVSTLERGGPVEQTLLLARGLRELGISVGATCADERIAGRFAAAGINASVLPMSAGADLAGARRLWRLMRGADVVHAQDRRAGLWVRVAPRILGAARIYTVHGLPDPYMPPPVGDEHPRLRDRLAYEVVDSGLGRRADALIVPSQALADTFVTRLRLPARRITVVPNGVDEVERVAERGPEVGTLALLEPVKDISTFLRAAELLAAQRPQLRFLIAGDGSQRAALERECAERGLAGVVTFAGYLPREEVLPRLSVLVLTSVVENAPMALLEAMSAGIPIVASRTGGIPEMLGDDAGSLVAPGDAEGFAAAIARLLDDRSLADAQISAGAHRIAERYTVEANARGTLAVYERVLSARG